MAKAKKKAARSKPLTERQIAQARKMLLKHGQNCETVGKHFGVSHVTIYRHIGSKRDVIAAHLAAGGK